MTDIESLPNLCLVIIFGFLDSKTLVSCFRVCKRWRKIINFTRRSRDILTESIDVGAEHENLPLHALTKAKIVTLDGFALFRHFTCLAHLKLDVDVSFDRDEAVQSLRDTLTSLSLGPNVRHEEWVNFWKDNRRLEKLEIVSSNTLNLEDLPETLKAFVAVRVNVLCLRPCHKSLTYLKISKMVQGFEIGNWTFDRLKTLVLGSSDTMPEQVPVLEHFEFYELLPDRMPERAPVLEHFEFHGPEKFDLVECWVRIFIRECHRTLTDVIVPNVEFSCQSLQFPRLKRLQVKSLTIEHPCDFPALKTFKFSLYHSYSFQDLHSFPEGAYQLENLAVRDPYLQPTFTENLVRFLKTLRRLKSFEFDRSMFLRTYLKSIPDLSMLKRLKISNVRRVNLCEFAMELDELEITTNSWCMVVLPSEGSIKNFNLEGNVTFVYTLDAKIFCPPRRPIDIERLTCNSFSVDGNFLRLCSIRGLVALRIDTGEWETECPDSFFEALEDGVFAVYASVHENFREEFERKIKLACPSLIVCSFLCSRNAA